jgi:hypothetical protein
MLDNIIFLILLLSLFFIFLGLFDLFFNNQSDVKPEEKSDVKPDVKPDIKPDVNNDSNLLKPSDKLVQANNDLIQAKQELSQTQPIIQNTLQSLQQQRQELHDQTGAQYNQLLTSKSDDKTILNQQLAQNQNQINEITKQIDVITKISQDQIQQVQIQSKIEQDRATNNISLDTATQIAIQNTIQNQNSPESINKQQEINAELAKNARIEQEAKIEQEAIYAQQKALVNTIEQAPKQIKTLEQQRTDLAALMKTETDKTKKDKYMLQINNITQTINNNNRNMSNAVRMNNQMNKDTQISNQIDINNAKQQAKDIAELELAEKGYALLDSGKCLSSIMNSVSKNHCISNGEKFNPKDRNRLCLDGDTLDKKYLNLTWEVNTLAPDRKWHLDYIDDFCMETTGNLTAKLKDGTILWETKTSNNPNAYLKILADGSVILYKSDKSILKKIYPVI